ncbi:hypothetical protein CDD82_1970 [Ophiocordyceps australis]|uniref:Uncharacterized protein n=1 Tax=Ophiocordyceps australis TaxID=1399860 RepID=A0A2C5Y507_9HYPO|nr:hypothetical protein CDD82_1970 [Ophiocordyceps australis]
MLLQTSLRGPAASSDAKQKVCPSVAVDSFHGCSNWLCGWERKLSIYRLPKWAKLAVGQRLGAKGPAESGDEHRRAATSIYRRGITPVAIMHPLPTEWSMLD